jgi:hypothetical protein
VAWSLSVSIGSYSQGLLLSGSCSVPIPVCLPGGPYVAFWICLLGSGSPGHEVALWYYSTYLVYGSM